MAAPKTDVTGKFTTTYTSLGRPFQANARVHSNVGNAAEKLFNSLVYAGNVYAKEKAKETPEDRLFKLEKEREINSKIAEDAAIFRYKPEEFLEKSNQSKEEFLADIPEDKWEWANLVYEQQMTRYHSAVTNNKIVLDRQKQTAAFAEQGQDYYNKALSAAANGDATSLAEYSMKWQENNEYMFNHGFITADAKVRMEKDFANAAVVQQNLFGAKQLFGNDEQLNGFLQNVDKSTIYSPEQKKSIKNNILSEYNSWHALNKVQAAETVKTADFGIKAYGMGIEPQGFDYDATLASLKASGQVDKAAQLESAYNIKNEVVSFAKLSPTQMIEELNEIKKTAQSEEDLSRLKLLSQVAVDAEKEIAEDPLAFAENHGVIESEPLDITKEASFAKRLQNAAFLQQKYGLDYAPVIKKSEADGLKKAIANMGAEQKAATLSQINQAFGDNANQIFEAVSPDNPEFAVAGKVFARNPQIAANIIAGTDIAANEKGFAPTQNTNLNNAFGKLDQALSNFDTEDRATIKKAVVANMTFINKKNNLFADGDALDADKVNSADEAIEQVLGGQIIKMSVGGGWFGDSYYTVLPENTDRDNFEEWLENLKDSDVGNAYVGDKKVSAKSIIDAGQLHYDDNNQYTVTINGDYVRDSKGNAIKLTYRGAK